uniref:Elongation of very long chain fatty acids protein n=1 Tax=Strongyloides stercoralis TaxID=6248 RepID=A0AAF5D2V3_STRER
MNYFNSFLNCEDCDIDDIPNSKFHHKYRMFFEDWLDESYISKLVSKYWMLSIFLAIFYLFGIIKLQSFMKKKQPYKLTYIQPLWNGILAIFSFIGLIRISEEMFFVLKDEAYWYFYFAVSKIFELGDTVLLVLKKKNLIFLHCYHHIVVLIYTWQSGAEQIGAGRWFIWMNFFAHTLMYTYFTIMSFNYRLIKKYAHYLTCIQILQMFVGITISGSVYFIRKYTQYKCKQTYYNLYFCFTIYLSFALLFVKFFIHSYYTKKVKTN